MSKYIDADRLKVEIEKHIKEVKDAVERFTPNMGFFDAKLSGIYDVMAIIDSLQQEQPDKYETALEKAREWMSSVNQGGHAILISIFPELGEGLDPLYGCRKQEQPEAFAKIAESYIFWTEYDEKMYTNLRATLCNLSVRDLIEKKTERKYVSWLDGFRPKSRRR